MDVKEKLIDLLTEHGWILEMWPEWEGVEG